MKKDDRIVYPPEAGPQAAYERVVVRRAEEPPPPANGPLRFGWVMMLLGGLFWGGLVWMYGRGTDFTNYMAPLQVFDAAPSYGLPVLCGLGGLAVLAALLAMARGFFLRAVFLLVAGPVMVALCLAAGTFLRVQFGNAALPGMPPAAEAGSEVSLTNKEGWEIKGRFLSLEGDGVKLIVNGKPSEVKLSSLNETSRQKVKQLEAAQKH